MHTERNVDLTSMNYGCRAVCSVFLLQSMYTRSHKYTYTPLSGSIESAERL